MRTAFIKFLVVITVLQAAMITALLVQRTPVAQAGKEMTLDGLTVKGRIYVVDPRTKTETVISANSVAVNYGQEAESRIYIGKYPGDYSKEAKGNIAPSVGIAMFSGLDLKKEKSPLLFLGIDRKEAARLYMGWEGNSSIAAEVSTGAAPQMTLKGRGYQPMIVEPGM